jgi:putative redox protein
MKARIKLSEGMTFVAESGSGHAIISDAAPDIGGRNLGARPMELVLMGTGACTAIDVMHILRKARQPVTDCVVELDADRAETDPKVFTTIRMRYIVTGRGLDPAQVQRAVKLSKEKYCSATIMLAATVAITYDVEVREA